MTIAEKFRQLTRVMNKAALSREASLPEMAVTNILAKNSRHVHFATAKALARVLDVDVAWLLDDEQDWPPIRVEHHEQKAVA